jgi:hypothetical protein
VSTIFDATTGGAQAADTSPLTLGVRFRSSVDCNVTGVRYYRRSTPADPGSGQLGGLFTATSTGALSGNPALASVAFGTPGADGWTSATFATPYAITADTDYYAAVYFPNGSYCATSLGFASAITNGTLTAVADSGTTPNGVFVTNGDLTPPTNSFNSTNYWVDVTTDTTAATGWTWSYAAKQG